MCNRAFLMKRNKLTFRINAWVMLFLKFTFVQRILMVEINACQFVSQRRFRNWFKLEM